MNAKVIATFTGDKITTCVNLSIRIIRRHFLVILLNIPSPIDHYYSAFVKSDFGNRP